MAHARLRIIFGLTLVLLALVSLVYAKAASWPGNRLRLSATVLEIGPRDSEKAFAITVFNPTRRSISMKARLTCGCASIRTSSASIKPYGWTSWITNQDYELIKSRPFEQSDLTVDCSDGITSWSETIKLEVK